jgi:cytochrome c oxidase accessory protein FixG
MSQTCPPRSASTSEGSRRHKEKKTAAPEACGTLRTDGSRAFVYASDSRGKYTARRRAVGWLLIAVYLALPWIHVNGRPAVLLDIGHRRFHFFGTTLAAQDVWLFFFVITGLGFSLFFTTALLGRLWCGWACPQTVFLDHVYRRIERLIEGDAVKRRALVAAPWTWAKWIRRATKHGLYVLASAIITHLLLAYFVSLPELWQMVTHAPGENWHAFIFSAGGTAVLYFNFGWFREQLCIVLCPYGRMQSAMIDEHSLVVGYDAKRGEPRGRLGTVNAGACLDCNRCVQVCPTGIDIRQGLQMECVSCFACIDACDEVMARVGRPKGLIRYDSQAGFSGDRTRWWRPRIVLYLALLMVGIGAATVALLQVRSFSASVTRLTGAPYVVEQGTLRNQFMVRVVNKSAASDQFTVDVQSPLPIRQIGIDEPVAVQAMGEVVRPMVVQIARDLYQGPFQLRVVIRSSANPGRPFAERIEFLGPDPELLSEGSK